MKIDKIYNEDCLLTMRRMGGGTVDIILTSPPYNTERTSGNSEEARDRHYTRYDIYDAQMSKEEYVDWTIELFNSFDKILSSTYKFLLA